MLVQTQPSLIHWFMKAQSRDLTKWLCAKRVLRDDNQGLLCSILKNSSVSAFPKNQCHGIVCGVILHEHAVKLEKRFVSSQFSLSSPSTWGTSRKISGKLQFSGKLRNLCNDHSLLDLRNLCWLQHTSSAISRIVIFPARNLFLNDFFAFYRLPES